VAAEIGTETIDVHAPFLTAEERQPIWQEQERHYPGLEHYEEKTDGVIPVVLLTRP
jgi:hypothetical protein